MELNIPPQEGTLNNTQVIAFQSYFLVLGVLAAIAVAYLAYKLGWLLLNLRSTFICEQYCADHCECGGPCRNTAEAAP